VVDELDHPNKTVIAMAFPSTARTVSLYFQGSLADRMLPLKLLSKLKARKAGLQPFRYFAIAFEGNSCLSRFITHDQRGDILFDGGHMRCQS
jgi:hypothetical protein